MFGIYKLIIFLQHIWSTLKILNPKTFSLTQSVVYGISEYQNINKYI